MMLTTEEILKRFIGKEVIITFVDHEIKTGTLSYDEKTGHFSICENRYLKIERIIDVHEGGCF